MWKQSTPGPDSDARLGGITGVRIKTSHDDWPSSAWRRKAGSDATGRL